MIGFRQFLTEARMAPLYHGTLITNLGDIVRDGIKPYTTHNRNKIKIRPNQKETAINSLRGVSASRNFNFAKGYGQGVVLGLDQNRLAQRYRIVPFQFWQGKYKTRETEDVGQLDGHNEYEEFILTTKPIPFSYVNKIYVRSVYADYDIINELRQKYGSSFIVKYND